MRRAASGGTFEVVVKAPTLGLYTRVPKRQPDVRAATSASNVRFENGVAKNAPGYGVLDTSPELPKTPLLFKQIVFDRAGKFSTSSVLGTSDKLYSLFRYPEDYVRETCATYDADIEALPDSLQVDYTFDAVDVYGSKGFIWAGRCTKTEETRPFWEQCPNLCFCDGPETEGDSGSLAFERYPYRWKFSYDGSYFYQRREGLPQERVSPLLFPDAFPGCERFSVSFDQNARPVIATLVAGTVEVRNLQAGALVTMTFSGASPVLVQNALLQPDSNLQDVVCYYLNGGHLYGRCQRDGFATAYQLVENIPVSELRTFGFSRVKHPSREFLFGMSGSFEWVLRSGQYPFIPYHPVETQAVLVSFVLDGAYTLVVEQADGSDSAEASIAFAGDGLYYPVTMTLAEVESASAAVAFLSDGAYTEVVVPTSASDASMTTVAFNADGAYMLSIVPGGSYAEGQTATVAFNADGDYSL